MALMCQMQRFASRGQYMSYRLSFGVRASTEKPIRSYALRSN